MITLGEQFAYFRFRCVMCNITVHRCLTCDIEWDELQKRT